MPQRKFGGGSVKSSEDYYGNTEQGYMDELFASPSKTSKMFRYSTKTQTAVPTKALINNLRLLAKQLEESKVENVMFTVTIEEATVKPRLMFPKDSVHVDSPLIEAPQQ